MKDRNRPMRISCYSDSNLRRTGMESSLRRFYGIFIFAGLLTGPLSAASPQVHPLRRVDAGVRGQLVEASGAADQAEVVRFGDGVAPDLLATAPEQTVRIAGWPVAPGERAYVVL